MQLSTQQEFRLLSPLTGVFVAALLIANVGSAAKIVQLGPLAIPGGTLVFPVTFIFNDILTETYGFVRTRKVIWTGFASLLLASVVFWLIGVLPAAPFWTNQDAYDSLLGSLPRIVPASMTAYFLGEWANSVVLSKMKYRAKGARGVRQGWRFVASTIVGEGIDSAVFMIMAFSGTLTAKQLAATTVSLYVFKVICEVLATPFTTRFANWVKKVEGVDEIDYPERTSYNPFAVFRIRQSAQNPAGLGL
jgi:uncharacterized integral membrane protein (TIGR00697 family)